jgi:putative membrane protein
MLQHLLITFIVPPLFLLATPAWLVRLLLLERGISSRVLRRLTHPVVAGLIFNALAALSHWSSVVRQSAESGAFHYATHLAMFSSALLMWMPVAGPLRELRLSPPGQMVYLFLMSVIPTIPAAWLTFADGTVYGNYDDGYELWSISVRSDQQAAGLIMKLLGGAYLWTIIIVKFFAFSNQHRSIQNLRPATGRRLADRESVEGP